MSQTVRAAKSVTPAEHYLRVLWAGRLPFLGSVAVSVAAAALITALQPRLYTSQAILSVKPSPQIEAEALRTGKPLLGANGRPYDANDPDRQSGPGRYAPRLATPGLVTLAARDAGIIREDQTLDDRQAAAWVSAERVEASDLVMLLVSQPTSEAAQKLASAIVTRGLEANRREEAATPTPWLNDELEKAAAAMDEAEQTVVRESALCGGAEREVRVDRAKLELGLARERYAAVRNRLADLDRTAAERRLQVTVVDAPTRPAAPSFPRPALNLSVGFAFGLLAGAAFVTLRTVLS